MYQRVLKKLNHHLVVYMIVMTSVPNPIHDYFKGYTYTSNNNHIELFLENPNFLQLSFYNKISDAIKNIRLDITEMMNLSIHQISNKIFHSHSLLTFDTFTLLEINTHVYNFCEHNGLRLLTASLLKEEIQQWIIMLYHGRKRIHALIDVLDIMSRIATSKYMHSLNVSYITLSKKYIKIIQYFYIVKENGVYNIICAY
jgi:hypothetical protein